MYGKYEEDIVEDAPEPLDKRIVHTHYFDASLIHDVLSRKAVTGVCTFYNKTHIGCYYKQQSTSKKATYGAEFLSGKRIMKTSLIIEHTSNTLESLLGIWTMYGEIMRA